MSKIKKPVAGTICNGLINEDYEYHLSGDCADFCKCVLTDKHCIGMEVDDPEGLSSQFFSRGRNIPNENRLKGCPTYGLSSDTFVQILKEKTEVALNNKLNNLKK